MIKGWTPDQETLKHYYADWARTHLAPDYSVRYTSCMFAATAWQALAETDFWRLALPKGHGGLGGSVWDQTAALEGLATAGEDVGFLLSVVAQAGFLQGLVRMGTEAQQARFLPGLLAGDTTAIGIAEPQSGTDVPNVQTVATPEKSGYVLRGEKWHLAHGNTAAITMVVAKIAGQPGLTTFLVPTDAPHFQAGEPFQSLGIRTLPIASQSYQGVALGADAVFGHPGKGLVALGSAVGLARVYYGLVAACLLETALGSTYRFLAERSSFGKPILNHQHVQHKLTDVRLGIDQARWTAYGALHHLEDRTPEAVRFGSVAKLSGTDALKQGAVDLLSLWSSHGYQADHPVARLAQDALGLLSVGGTEETHRINIFNQMQRRYK